MVIVLVILVVAAVLGVGGCAVCVFIVGSMDDGGSAQPAAPANKPHPKGEHCRKVKTSEECSDCCGKCCQNAVGISRGMWSPEKGCTCFE